MKQDVKPVCNNYRLYYWLGIYSGANGQRYVLFLLVWVCFIVVFYKGGLWCVHVCDFSIFMAHVDLFA